jgi:hypothetical protein
MIQDIENPDPVEQIISCLLAIQGNTNRIAQRLNPLDRVIASELAAISASLMVLRTPLVELIQDHVSVLMGIPRKGSGGFAAAEEAKKQ